MADEASEGSGWYAALARAGLVAKGVSFVIVGGLAVQLALGGGGKATSREGALQSLSHHSLGKLLLVLLAIGFASYALWRFVQAFAEREDPTDGEAEAAAKKWGKRAGYVGRGLIYAALAASSVKILTGSSSGSQNERAHHAAAVLLGLPAGTWLVGLTGTAILGAGLWNLYRGFSRSFEQRWRTGRMSRRARLWGGRAGFAGHLARGVVFSLVGIFVVKAALDYNPRDAIGLDGALQKLAHTGYGPYLLGVTAAGLVCYGVFCFVDARYRDVSANARS